MSKTVVPSLLEWGVALSVFSYLCFMVLVPEIYGVVPGFLLLLSLVFFRYRSVVRVLGRDDWRFVLPFLSYVIVAIGLIVWHGDDVSSFDRPSRFLGAVLILTLLLRVRLSPLVVFAGGAIGGLAVGLYSAYEVLIGDVGRVTSFDNAIYFGNGALVLALVTFCGLTCSLHGKHWSLSWIVLLVTGFSGAMLGGILSGTRGGWLAVPLIFLLAVWTYRRYVFKHPRALVASTSVMLLLGVAFFSLNIVENRIGQAVEQTESYFEDGHVYSSVGLRLEMWRAGWMLFVENPVAGVGEDRFDSALNSLVDEGRVNQAILTFRHLHNQFVDHAAKGGVLAVLALLAVFLGPMKLFAPYMRSDVPVVAASALMGMGFTLAFMVFCLTQGMFSRNIGVMMYVIVPMLAWTMIRQTESREKCGRVGPHDSVDNP